MVQQHGIAGFTLIELLMVIAIIGVLSSIVLSNLSGARNSAQEAKTEVSLRTAQTASLVCMDGGDNLTVPDVANAICPGQDNWPAPVGLGWVYGTVGTCGFDGDTSDNTFLFCATDGVSVVTCTQDGCTTT